MTSNSLLPLKVSAGRHSMMAKVSVGRHSMTAKVLPLLAVLFAFTSCLKDQEEAFEQSAPLRLQATLDQMKHTLRSAPYGWELEYYSAENFGGIVYTIKFDSLSATIGCSLVPDSTDQCLYRLTSDSGPVLSFDTYSPLLHYFSTPSSSEYEAKGGEFEFVVSNITDSLITIYGKKSRRNMQLRRLKATAEDYSQRTIDIYDNLPQGFKGQIGTADIEGLFSMTSKRLNFVDGTDTIATVSFVVNNQGIRLYNPITLGGKRVQAFAFNQADTTFTCLDAGSADVVLKGMNAKEGIVPFKNYAGNYNLRYNGNSSSTRVELAPNRLENTYSLRGLSSKYELKLHYNDATGYLTLAPQTVGDIGGNAVYFATYSIEDGHLWISDEASFTLKWNNNKVRVGYHFTATNPSRYNCTSALLVTLAINADGTASASLVDDPAWGPSMLTNLSSLQKLAN